MAHSGKASTINIYTLGSIAHAGDLSTLQKRQEDNRCEDSQTPWNSIERAGDKVRWYNTQHHGALGSPISKKKHTYNKLPKDEAQW